MPASKDQPPRPPQSEADQRAERLAKALRENLRRRKTQERGRTTATDEQA